MYDELLAGALRALARGPRNLSVEDPWAWLLGEFAAQYGVRQQYASLSYLKWVVCPDVATITADCFEVVLHTLRPLKEAQAAAELSSAELGVLAQVAAAVDRLLMTTFENYFMLR